MLPTHSSDEDSDDDEEEYLYYVAIRESRYLSRERVEKTGRWTPNRLEQMDGIKKTYVCGIRSQVGSMKFPCSNHYNSGSSLDGWILMLLFWYQQL